MLEGEISQINLIERLVELWRERFTGAIRFENDGIIKIIYFKDGDILSASTNDRSDSIDEILMRAGKVSREHVKQALAKRKESESLGDALLNLGFITRKELTWSRRVQVVGVIRSIAAWTDGSFTIVADYLPKRDEGTLFPLPQVLVELIVTEQDRTRFERALDGGEVVFAKADDFAEVWRRLGLNEDADAISNEIDGARTATEVAAASNRDTFNVYKLLHALETLRVLTRVEKPRVQPQFSLDDFATAGVADAADLWNDPAPELAPETPQFDLDESAAFAQPTMEVPFDMADDRPADVSGVAADDDARPYSIDEGPVVAAPTLSWEEPEAVPAGSGAFDMTTTAPEPEADAFGYGDETSPMLGAPKPMPSWEAPPRDALSVPIQAVVEPPAEPSEEQWGFDEAQIETARRATVEPIPTPTAAAPAAAARAATTPRRPTPRRRQSGLLVALLLLAVLAGAGYYGFMWWQAQQGASDTDLVAQTPVRARRQPGAAPMATTPPAGTSTATTGLTPAAAAPAGTPTVITPTGAATSTVAEATPANVTPTVVTPSPAAGRAPTVVTPTAPAPVATALPRATAGTGGAGRERIDAMAREYASNPTGNYTVQIQILCDPNNVERTMRTGGEAVWFVPQTIGGRSCYRVFWGRYASRDEAQRSLGEVPPSIRDRSAAVKSVPR